jgi:hypothetical protein
MIGRMALLSGVLLLAAWAAVHAGCGVGNPPPPAAGTRAIYAPDPIVVVCDRGNLIYRTGEGALQVLPGACPEGKP